MVNARKEVEETALKTQIRECLNGDGTEKVMMSGRFH